MEIGLTVAFPFEPNGASLRSVLTAPAVVISVMVSALLVTWRALLVEVRQDRYRSLVRAALAVLAGALPLATLVCTVPGLDNGTRVQVLALILTVAGWFMTYLQGQTQSEEDQLDLVEALGAEISFSKAHFQDNPPLQALARLDGLVDEAIRHRRDYAPFIPAPSRPIVFEALASKTDQLPTELVVPIVRYYSLLADIRVHAEELQSERFVNLPIKRRRIAYARHFIMLDTLRVYADEAINAVNGRFAYRGLAAPRPKQSGDGAEPCGKATAPTGTAFSRTDPGQSDPGPSQPADGG